MKNLAIGLILGLGLPVLGLSACSTDKKDDTTDSDGDGIPDSVEKGDNPSDPVDTDADGKADYLDTDSDGDGIPDHIEAGDDPQNPRDTDSDGKPDYMETDSDNDGIPDNTEAGDDPAKPRDSDGDGTPDYMDSDSDNDGNPDSTDSTNIDKGEIQSGCKNIFAYCSADLEIRVYSVDAETCQTVYTCVVDYYADDSRCMGLLIDGWTCLETMTAADACPSCNDKILKLENTGCERPDPCLPAKDAGI